MKNVMLLGKLRNFLLEPNLLNEICLNPDAMVTSLKKMLFSPRSNVLGDPFLF